MSYQLEDANGWLGDFATNRGLKQLEEDTPKDSALGQFLETGEADAELVAAMIEQCKGSETLEYIAGLLVDAEPPVIVTSGQGREEKPETLRAELSPRVRAGLRAYAAQQRVAVELGVPPGWLDPLRDWFRVLQAKVEDGRLSDAEVQTFVAEALDRMPELFGEMDHDALAKVLEVAMGQAVIEGVRKGIADKPRKAKKV